MDSNYPTKEHTHFLPSYQDKYDRLMELEKHTKKGLNWNEIKKLQFQGLTELVNLLEKKLNL